ncbi:hypothetical protein A3Q56_07259 [Intoshia linei]|uniref:Uncharacterized protein n=1 Tax=Intoshia linei TaxID=1819745 RepID=A0A177AUF7_9BILA|nr:hypothetical protein A3Q56_07259 [Intoshia linei]
MYNKSDKYVKDWLPFNLSCDEVSNCEIEDLSHLKIEDTNTDYSSFSSKKEYVIISINILLCGLNAA